MRLPESEFDAVTALSGSGPAYLFYIAEAMIDAGISLRLGADSAADIIAQTLFGAAALLKQSGESPQQLRDDVSSPGGTTQAAIVQFDRSDARGIVFEALKAARDRSREP